MSLLQMSFSGAILILAIIGIRALTISKLPKKTFLALWGVALVRLLVPFSLPSVFSVYSVMERSAPVMQTVRNTHATNFFPAVPNRGMATLPDVAAASKTGSTLSVWSVVWVAGMVVCFVFFAISYIRWRREFQTSLPVENEFVKDWLAIHKACRPIDIRQSARISAPLTYGVFRPVILMPKGTDWNDTKSLQYVFAHEYTHIRRFDAVTKLVLIAVLCIHWFNPLVWVMYIIANRDLELSCDEAVVRHFGDGNKAEYARTLINMEEAQSGLPALCNSFSKNAIEERVTAIMKIRKTPFIAICAAVVVVAGITVAFATSASSNSQRQSPTADTNFTAATASDLSSIMGKNFTEDEYNKLSALQFDGYQSMTVSEFQKRIWTLTDTAEYRDLLERFVERFAQDVTLYAMEDSNETASFLFNVLFPLTGEQWPTWDFGNYMVPDCDVPNEAKPEYHFTMTIRDADTLTVGEYDSVRLGIMKDVSELLKKLPSVAQQTDPATAFQPEIVALSQKYSSDSLEVSIQVFFMPRGFYFFADSSTKTYGDEKEPQQYESATKEDYASLLTLKTADYRQMTVSRFNAAVLDWANNHSDAWDRICEDVALNDYQVALTDEERSFVALTTMLSGEENFCMIQSDKTGRPEKDPFVDAAMLSKETGEEVCEAWCDLWYQFSYHITDKDRLTIGERDDAIGGVISAVQAFWDETELDDALKLTKRDVVAKISSFATKCSTDLISIVIDEDDVQLEGMDERDCYFN